MTGPVIPKFTAPPPKKRGPKPRAALTAPRPVGRPKNEVKQRMLEIQNYLVMTKGKDIIQTMVDKALDPADKDQAAMLLALKKDILVPEVLAEVKQEKKGFSMRLTSADGTSVTLATGDAIIDDPEIIDMGEVQKASDDDDDVGVVDA